MVLDKYLEENDLTRYRLSKVSGIPETNWFTASNSEIGRISPRYLLAIGNALGKSAGEVLDELIELELENDELNGLGKVLDQYGYRNEFLELEIKSLLDKLDELGVNVLPFTFNRLELEENPDLDKVMHNIIESLKTSIKNVKAGNPPFPE